MKKLVNHFTGKPKTLFLIDSIGALVSAQFLLVIARQFSEHFGMPQRSLTYLSIIASCLCIYSAACHQVLKGNWTPFLRFIGIANLTYCALTIGLLIYHYPLITKIGVTYLITEVAIICGLSYVELNVAASIRKQVT